MYKISIDLLWDYTCVLLEELARFSMASVVLFNKKYT